MQRGNLSTEANLRGTKSLNNNMENFNDKPLVARSVSIRNAEREKLRNKQRREMNQRMVDAPSKAFNQSLAAERDIDMRDALAKVRESNVTIPDTLTKLHGTYIYRNK